MKYYRCVVFLFAILVCLLTNAVYAQNTKNVILRVGTKQAPPFAIKNNDGTWNGISIGLWRDIAEELDIKYELYEFDLKGLLQAAEKGKVDVGVAALTINADREKLFDFSQPFYNSGLGIAVKAKAQGNLIQTLGKIFSYEFIKIVVALFLILLVFGFLIWFFEHKNNNKQFGGKPLEGIGSGLWWSAVTMTTVGYGDKAPATFMGRVVAIIWMFMAIIIISSFTAAITSTLTVSQLDVAIKDPSDLHRVVVGTVADSTSEQYLRDRGIKFHTYPSMAQGFDSLVTKRIEAFIYDAPLLRYQAKQSYHGQITVLPYRFEYQSYGFAFPSGSRLREEVNRILLKRITGKEWEDTVRLYLGE